MFKFLSVATLVGVAFVLSSADASATFFRKKKKGNSAPCCEGTAVGHPTGQHHAAAPMLGTSISGLAAADIVPVPMPSVDSVIVPAIAPVVVPSNFTQSAYGTSGVVPTGYAMPMPSPSNSGKKRLFR